MNVQLQLFQMRRRPAGVSQNEWQEVVRSIVRSERQVEARRNNVILSGVPVAMKPAEVTDLLVRTIPDLAGEIRGTHRLGREATEDAQRNRPRPVKVELTPRGKARLWQRRRDLKHGESPIYVNNNLSIDEHVNRKAALPKYKVLIAAGVRCSMPRDRILQDARDPQQQHLAHVFPKRN